MIEKFLNSFPPPEYLDVPYSAIVFSNNSIRSLVLDKKTKHPIFFSEIFLEPGVIEMGKVKNEEVLVKLLSGLKDNFPSPFIKFSIPDEASYVFTVRLPALAGGSLQESVAFILEENVPLPLSDISFDFVPQKIEESIEAGEKRYSARVAVVAASTSLISSYDTALMKAHLSPLCCINESQASAYSVVPKEVKTLSAIVHVHKESAGIYIAEGQLVEFSSTVLFTANSPLVERARLIKLEVEKAVDYWKSKGASSKRESNILPVFICGEHEVLEILEGELSQIENVKQSLGNVWANAFKIEDYIPTISFEDSLRFSSAIGLFLNHD